MRHLITLSALAVAASLVTPASAVAPGVGVDSGRYTIGISGFVPVICRATVGTAMVSPSAGTVSLGSLNEFCNSPGGYRVHADYSPNLAQAKLMVDGQVVALDEAGSSVISASDHAAIQSRDLVLDLPEGVTGGSISFRIEPL